LIARPARFRELLEREGDGPGSLSFTALCSLDDGSAFTLRLTEAEYRTFKAIPAAKRNRMVMTLRIAPATLRELADLTNGVA